MRARTELFIPAGDSVSLVSFSFSATLWTRENFPLHLLLLFLHSVSFFLTFLSFHFFHLFFPSTIQPRGNPAPYSSREIFSKTGIVFLIFLANHSPGISLRRNFYLSLSPFFFRFLSSTSQEILSNAFLTRAISGRYVSNIILLVIFDQKKSLFNYTTKKKRKKRRLITNYRERKLRD